MVRFMDRLNEKMELLDEKIQNKAAKAGEDYLSFFESHAEEVYKEYYLYKCFRDLRKKARESGSPEKVLEYLKKRQNVCLDTLLRQDIAARSTSPMANMAHTLSLECMQRLIQDCLGFSHILSLRKPEQDVKEENRQSVKHRTNRLKR